MAKVVLVRNDKRYVGEGLCHQKVKAKLLIGNDQVCIDLVVTELHEQFKSLEDEFPQTKIILNTEFCKKCHYEYTEL